MPVFGAETKAPSSSEPPQERALILGASLPNQPDVELVAAVCRAGGVGVLDLTGGRLDDDVRRELGTIATPFAIRLETGLETDPEALPAQCRFVVLPVGAGCERWRSRAVLAEVTSVEQARQAARANAAGVIVRGSECGACGGEETAFVLMQHVLQEVELPVWVQGGIGLHTAAASVAGGAAGVVLDIQLALASESSLAAGLGSRGESLPVSGPDADLALSFAQRFRTAGRIVRAVRESIFEHLRAARAVNPLAEGSALAAAHGTRYPVVQGPMTRVSDGPAFAEAVAKAGALPMLAMALLQGDPVRSLLSTTRERLSGMPWGVGILGFVPTRIRQEQLAAILEARPRFALIAGGRPSQARPLEEAGIATYLHVPSPGLLELFLKDGARRFVFEGSECGGHVGPHSSFSLWERQLDRLLKFDRPEQLSLLFAGGIHDGLSAAMVAALTAPLARRGAKIGVLMGTAYLFTREAVETGAIRGSYQDVARECERTVLLETTPGHATRCAQTEYVAAFSEERQRLEQRGLDRREIWTRLEKRNLGRLRLATKGVRRDGPETREVDTSTQLREGLFMLGQVATLRREICSMADLHREVSQGSTDRLAQIPLPQEKPEPPCEIAIVGMACVFPGAPDLPSFWANIVQGTNSITEVPPQRWDPQIYYDSDGPLDGKTPSKWGGFLDAVMFDPVVHGIPPRSLTAIEPVQLLSLEVARRALADAGYTEREFNRQHTSVIFGAESGNDLAAGYGFRALYPQYLGAIPPELDERLPRLTEDSFPGVLANVIAGRVANRLDLGGVNYTVDAACASSLAAIDLACKELTSGSSDMVLCGGADLHNSIGDYLLFASVRALSSRGVCSTFDSDADGIVLGEGVAVVVLKRLEDAVQDGDRVYCVIRGIAGSSDGRSLGLTAPRREGQVRALERAYSRARLSPARVGLIEAHGTGTVVGDATELGTLDDVFAAAGASQGSCVLGSVKAQIGHTKCAAGLAGLVKAALAIHHGVLPPARHIRQPNAAYRRSTSPFAFLDRAMPWTADEKVAGVSAFGFGGTNFHAVLGQVPGSAQVASGLPLWPAELFLFRAADREAMLALASRLQALLRSGAEVRLRDLAWSVWRAGEGPVRGAVVAKSTEELLSCLDHLEAGNPKRGSVFLESPREGKVAFLFPGQGSQKPGMLSELFAAFPTLRDLLSLVPELTEKLFSPAAFSAEEEAEQRSALADTRVAQPALGVCDLAIARLLRRSGVEPDMMAGHSYGELVALCEAGAFTPQTLIALSRTRARCILEAAGDEPGAMAAVAAAPDDVAEQLSGASELCVANHNSPRQSVIAGPRAAVEDAVSRLAARGVAARVLPVSCAFHSPRMRQAGPPFARALEAAEIAAPVSPVWSNIAASPYLPEPEDVRRRLTEQIGVPVLFAQMIEAMYQAGARVFVEAGPGQVLSGLVGDILRERPHTVVRCSDGGRDEIRHFLGALAQLAVLDVPVDLAPLFEGRGAEAIDLDEPARFAPPDRVWRINGYSARPWNGVPPKPAMPAGGPSVGAVPRSDRDRVLSEFLRNMQEMVKAQRDAVLSYLGAAPEEDLPTQESTAPEVTTTEARVAPPPADPAAELIAIFSEQTGYPPEALDLDLDLEADFSIDSIKRMEIIGALAARLGLDDPDPDSREKMIDQLAGMRTLREMTVWLKETIATHRAEASPPADSERSPSLTPRQLQRFVMSHQRVPAAEARDDYARGRRFLVVGDRSDVLSRLKEMLVRDGGRVLEEETEASEADVIVAVELAPETSPDGSLHRLLAMTQAVASSHPCRLVVLSAYDQGLEGTSGFLKSVAKERPSWSTRLVELDAHEGAEEIATRLYREVGCEDELSNVSYAGGARRTRRLRAQPLNGSGQGLELDADSVILITGGARGITSGITTELARRYGSRLVIVGRTPMPQAEPDPEIGSATDAPALRKLLFARGEIVDASRIEAEIRRIHAEREIRRTLEEVERTGAGWEYHAVDVRDTTAFSTLLAGLYERHGRLDGVLHAAGVIEDRLVDHKTWDSFARVYETKVSPVRALAEGLREDVRFVALFSSVSGVFGNRGQADYAAASDALGGYAKRLKERLRGRVVSIAWGPWEGAGMVSEELARELRRRGMELIGLQEGVEAFFRELESGDPADAEVVWMHGTEEGYG